MTTHSQPALNLDRLLARFARRRRRLLLLRSLASATATLLVGLIVVAGVDRLFVVGVGGRVALSTIAYAAAAGVFLKAGGWRWLRESSRRPGEDDLSRMIESADPRLRDRLLAAVELRDAGNGSDDFRQAAVAEADRRARGSRPDRLLPRRLAGWRVAAASLVALAVLTAIVLPQLGHLRLGRLLARAALPAADFPRASRLDVRWTHDDPLLVPVGGSVDVEVTATPLYGPPATGGRVVFRGDDGTTSSVPMDGDLTATLAPPSSGEVVAWVGDGDTRQRRVEVVPRPAVASASATYAPPPYLDDPIDPPTTGGDLTALAGSTAAVSVEATQPVDMLKVERLADDLRTAESVVEFAASPVNVAVEAGHYRVRVRSAATGFWSADEPVWRVEAVPDAPPTVALAAEPAGGALPADALVPVSAEAADDVRLDRLAVQARVDGGDWADVAADEAAGSFMLDFAQLDVAPGQAVEVRATAADAAGATTATPPVGFVVIDRAADPAFAARVETKRRLAETAEAFAGDVGHRPALERLAAAGADSLADGGAADGRTLRVAARAAVAAHALDDPAAADGVRRLAGELLRADRIASATAEALAAAEGVEAAADAADAERLGRRLATLAEQAGTIGETIAVASADLPAESKLTDAFARAREAADRAVALLAEEPPKAKRAADRFRDAARRLAEAQRLADDRAGVEADVLGEPSVASLVGDADAADALALLAAVEARGSQSPAALVRAADLALIRAAARADVPGVAEAAATLDAGHLVAELRDRMATPDAAVMEAIEGPRRRAAAGRDADAARDALLLAGHDAKVSREVGRAKGEPGRLAAAADLAEPAMEAAREALRRAAWPSLADDLRDAAGAARAGETVDAADLAERLREAAAAEDLLDFDAIDRARDAEAAAAAVEADAGEDRLAETLDRAADALGGDEAARQELRAREDELGLAERAAGYERLRDLLAAADGDEAAMREALEKELADNAAMREELGRLAESREAAGAAAVRSAAEREAGAARSLREALADAEAGRGEEAEAARRKVAEAAEALANDGDSEALRDAAWAAAGDDPAAAKGALERAAAESRQRAEAARQAAANAEQKAAESRQAASDAFEAGGDFATPYREMEAAQAEAEAGRDEATRRERVADEAERLAGEADPEANAAAQAKAAAERARQEAAAAQDEVAEDLAKAAGQMRRAAGNRRALGEEAAAEQAQAAAEAAERAAEREVAQAKNAAESQEASDAEAAQAVADAAAALRQQDRPGEPQAGGEASGEQSPGTPGTSPQAGQDGQLRPGSGSQSQSQTAGGPTGESAVESALARAVDALSGGGPNAVAQASEAMAQAAESAARGLRESARPSPLPPPSPEPSGEPMAGAGTESSPLAPPSPSPSPVPVAAELGELPADDGRAWGGLRPEQVDRLMTGRRDAAPAAYRERVDAYYRLLAERAREEQ